MPSSLPHTVNSLHCHMGEILLTRMTQDWPGNSCCCFCRICELRSQFWNTFMVSKSTLLASPCRSLSLVTHRLMGGSRLCNHLHCPFTRFLLALALVQIIHSGPELFAASFCKAKAELQQAIKWVTSARTKAKCFNLATHLFSTAFWTSRRRCWLYKRLWHFGG